MFGTLYAGIAGLFLVCTISVGLRGDTFYSCFNAAIRIQRQKQGKLALLKVTLPEQ